MSLNALKETKLASTFCRMNSPSSPSKPRPMSSQAPARMFRSKILAVVDAELPFILNENKATVIKTSRTTKKPSSSSESHSVAKPQASTTRVVPIGFPVPVKFTEVKEGKQTTTEAIKEAANLKPKSRKRAFKEKDGQSVLPLVPETILDEAETQDSESTKAPEQQLPLYSYEDYHPTPTVVYTRHEEEADDLVQMLKGPLGFDLEWRILWTRGKMYDRRTALVQLCDKNIILLIHVANMKRFPKKVKEILESSNVVKTGVNIRNDGLKLFKDFGILPENLVELGAYAHQADPTFKTVYRRSIVSLARMVEMYTSKALDKGKVRTGDWERAPLSEEQMTYAANDAHCALAVFNCLRDTAKDNSQEFSPESFTTSLTQEYTSGKLLKDLNSSNPSWLQRIEMEPTKPSPQYLRAYRMWHERKMSLAEIGAEMRSKENPLADSTVITYVIVALQLYPSLHYSMPKLKELVQMEAGSWARFRAWIIEQEIKNLNLNI